MDDSGLLRSLVREMAMAQPEDLKPNPLDWNPDWEE